MDNVIYKVLLAESYYDESSAIWEKYKKVLKLLFFVAVVALFFFPSLWICLISEGIIICIGLTFLGSFLLCKILKCFVSLDFKFKFKIFSKEIKFNLRDFIGVCKRFLKKTFLKCRYEFYEDVINEIKYKDSKYTDFLNICKLYYFNEEYEKANSYAQKALNKAKEEQKKEKEETEDNIDEDYEVFVYDWLSRIAYKTNNHVTAIDFYKSIIDCLIKNPKNIIEDEGIELKPKLYDMIQYLQENRTILNKREQARIVVPLVWSLAFAIVFEGLQIYSSLGDRENKHTGILYEKVKYCVLKICTATRLPKENIKDILVEREQNKEKEEKSEDKKNRENIIVALKSSELVKQQHKQKKSNAVIPVKDKHKKAYKPKEQAANYVRNDDR